MSGERDTTHDEAHRLSGLPGWLRPVRRLPWSMPRPTDAELQERLDREFPGPYPDDEPVPAARRRRDPIGHEERG